MSNSITAPITIIQNTINAPVTLGIIGGGGGDLTSGPVRATNGVSSIANGALSIAMTSGLQTAIDAKQATLTNYSTISALTGYPTSFPTTPADINNVGHAKLLGRHGAGTGTAQEIGIDGGLELQGGNIRRAALTGFIEASAGSGTTTLSASAASEGGNGAADAGKLLKFGASGDIKADSVTAYSAASEGGCALFPTEIALFNGATSTLLSTLATDLRSVVFKDAAGTVAFMSDIPDISTKQDTLVSGTNIKTVNGESLIGSGNVALPSLADAAIITGTSTTQGIVSPAQLKAAAEEHGGGGSSTTIITLASDTAARVSTTTFANETGLTLPTLTAEKAYKIEWAIIYSSGAGGIKTQFQVPSIKTANAFAIGSTYAAASPSNVVVTSGTPATIAGGTRAGINSKNTIVGFAYVFVDATGGVPQFQWAQNSSDAADTKILAGSVITITPLF